MIGILWQFYFAPEQTDQHELIVFDKHNSEVKSGCVLKFYLNVTQLHRSMKFPTVYGQLQHNKCRIYEPVNKVLEQGSTVPIHCFIPVANNVTLTIDLEWTKEEGYDDPILKRSIAVGWKEVTLYAQYGQKPSYDVALKYTVQ